MDPDLCRHQLMEQDSEEVREALLLDFVKPPLDHNRLQNRANFLLDLDQR